MSHSTKRNMMELVASLLLLAGAGHALADALPWWVGERRILGENNLEPIEATLGTPAYDKASVVARVETTSGMGFCTASRVGRDMFLTNFHCYDYKPCEKVQFHLGYEREFAEEKQKNFHCKEVLAKDLTLDYALYRVEVTEEALEFPVVTLWAGTLEVGQPLLLAGHPAARPKEIDRSPNCTLRTNEIEVIVQRKTITHTCDTEGVSSGSPVLDRATGYQVALHWGGMSQYNFAIPMSLIIKNLKANIAPDDFAALTIAR